MSNLIPVQPGQIGGTACQTVDARTLHEFLGVTYHFGNWIANRIKKYQFQENTDFEVFIKNSKNLTNGGRPCTEYTLTLDMAKELAMVERNDRGREARRYFIECEKRLLAPIAPPPPPRPGQVEALRASCDTFSMAAEIGRLKDENAALKDSVLALQRYKINVLEGPQKPKRPPPRPLSDAEKARILQLKQAGQQTRQIANAIGRSTSAVRSVIREGGMA